MKSLKFEKAKQHNFAPELEVVPRFNKTLKNTFIRYNNDEVNSVNKWIFSIDEFFEEYQIRQIEMNDLDQITTCSFLKPPKSGEICRADYLKNFGPCSPPDYGYYSNSPCIFLYLNKKHNWIPECYSNSEELPLEMPPDLVDYVKEAEGKGESNQIWVSCNGQFDTDKERIDNVAYYPSRGFPAYLLSDNLATENYYYLSPIVGVEINAPEPGVSISIECRLWAKNIEYAMPSANLIQDGEQRFSFEQTGTVYVELLTEFSDN